MKILKEAQQQRRKKKKSIPAAPEPGERTVEAWNTVVVGVRMDQQSPELLTWALVKVARPGDRVVALHVASSAPTADANALLAVVKDFESVIAVYEGFCNLKQIDLKLKVCRGSSIGRVLVQEAKSMAASSLILGVPIGSSCISIAKYCAKKLPGDCSVLAVGNGKIVFQREAPSLPSTENKNATDHDRPVDSVQSAHRTSSGNPSKPHDFKDRNMDGLLAIRCRERRNFDTKDDNLLSSDRRSCSICASVMSKESPRIQSKEKESLAIVPVPKSETPSSSVSLLIAESKPGWPLLRRALLINRKDDRPRERSKVSVVQWAMRLPSRYSASLSVHPDPKKPDASSTPNFHGKSAVVVPVGADSSPPAVAGRDEEKKLPKELESLQEKYSSVCRLFSYQELMHATSNFSPDNLVGKGGSSCVYKGRLSDGKQLAVKILKPSEDALQEFVSEVEIITTLHHKNIISLFGFCFDNNNLILVYDLLSRGSLEDILHGGKENKNALSWFQRYKVAVGVAEALDYLHDVGSSQPVIHRDVKSSNILLADDFEPQLSDFGLARWASAGSTHITCSDVAGTFGYLAPEYFMYGKVNRKIDVYAFGVVLLELLSGRKPVTSGCPKGQESLVMWAKPILQGGKVKQLLDPCLGDKDDSNQMERMALAASLCIRRASRSRPFIALVLKLLQGDEDALKWARSEAIVSEEFDECDDVVAARPDSNIQSHINLALLDIEDETLSISSVEQSVDSLAANISLEDYLRERCSRSASFD